MKQGNPRHRQKLPPFPFFDRVPFCVLPRATQDFRVELVKRLDGRLEPVFVKMEQTLGRIFDREVIKRLLFLHYDTEAGGHEAARETEAYRKSLSRKERDMRHIVQLYRSLLNEKWRELSHPHKEKLEKLLQETQPVLESILVDLYWERQIFIPGSRTNPWLSRKNCPPTSNAITHMIDYLCQQLGCDVDHILYKFVGLLITEVSTPSCLVCGTRHTFRNWRNVYARDHHRGQGATRKERVQRLRKSEHDQFPKDLQEHGFSLAVIQEQKESLKSFPSLLTNLFPVETLDLLSQIYEVRMKEARQIALSHHRQ